MVKKAKTIFLEESRELCPAPCCSHHLRSGEPFFSLKQGSRRSAHLNRPNGPDGPIGLVVLDGPAIFWTVY